MLSTEFQNIDRVFFLLLVSLLTAFFLFGMDFVIILTFITLSYKNANRCHTIILPRWRSIKVKVGIYGILGTILGNYTLPFNVIQGVL